MSNSVVKPKAIKLPETQEEDAQLTGDSRVWGLLSILLLAWIPAMFGRSIVSDAADLYHAAVLGTPYFVPGEFLAVYVLAPSVILSAIIMVLTPGLLLALAFNSGRNVAQWVLHGMLLSIVAVSVLTAVVQSLLRRPLTGNSFAAILLLLAVCSFGLLLQRMKRQTALSWPITDGRESMTLASMLVVPAVFLITLTPKFYWESFSGDGAHTFESARLLLTQPFPFWPTESGEIAGWPGMNTLLFLYPASCFIRLFGDLELAVRVPYLIFLAGVYAGILAVVSQERPDTLRLPERMLLWLGVLTYSIAMVFNASYSPYLADIALPTAQVTLAVALFLGFVMAFIQRSMPWLIMFGISTHLCLPSGLLLMGLWLGGVVLVMRTQHQAWIIRGIGVLIASVSLSAIAPGVLHLFGQHQPGQEHGVVGLLKHFAFLQFSDVRRFFFVSFASGILPCLGLFAWGKQDLWARVFTLVSASYFFFFYFQAHVALHYFAPVMLLPLVVFWRSFPATDPGNRRTRVIATIASVGFLSLVVSMPTRWDIYTESRRIGSTINNRLAGYAVSDPSVFRGSEILHSLFHRTWDPEVPGEYGGSPLTWNFYAFHRKGTDLDINYVVQYAADPPPEGMRRVKTEGDVTLYLASEELWIEHRAAQPSARVNHPVYSIDRGMLFRSVPLGNEPSVINVLELLEAAGIDTERLLRLLGVQT